MATHERFEAWQAAHALALEVFAITDHWPRSELYILTAQSRRAALSIPSNMAEGAGRRGPREFARYLNIALGSLAELRYLLRFSRDRGLCTDRDWSRLTVHTDHTGRLLFGLHRRMRR